MKNVDFGLSVASGEMKYDEILNWMNKLKNTNPNLYFVVAIMLTTNIHLIILLYQYIRHITPKVGMLPVWKLRLYI